MCLAVYPVKRKKIGGMKIKEFMENCSERELYFLDIDAYMGREMNIKVYNSLAGIYDMWIDAAPRRVGDVMDLLIMDAKYAVINDIYMRREEMQRVLELTDNVILKSYDTKSIEKFLEWGGRKILTSEKIASYLKDGELYVFRGKEVCLWKS